MQQFKNYLKNVIEKISNYFFPKYKITVSFNKIYGDPDAPINHSGASADYEISEGHEILKALQETIGTNSREVSLKGGNTIQIHLGNLPELTDETSYTISKNSKGHTCVEHGIPFSQQVESFRQKDFWDKYLKKGDILAYSYDDAGDGSHIFFNMDDVNDFIIKLSDWETSIKTLSSCSCLI